MGQAGGTLRVWGLQLKGEWRYKAGENYIEGRSESKVHKIAFDLFHFGKAVWLRIWIARVIIKSKIGILLALEG